MCNSTTQVVIPARPVTGRIFSALGRILRLARPYRWLLVSGFVLFVCATLVSLSLPLGVRSLLDTALRHRDARLLHQLAFCLVGLFLFRFVVSYAGTFCLLIAAERVAIDLRTRLFEHLQNLDVQFFRDSRIGDLTSRLGNDAAAVRAAVSENLVSSVLTLFQVVAAMVVMLVLNWRLALIVAPAAPAASFISKFYGPRLQRIARQAMDKVGRSMAFAQEVLSGILVVKSFDRSRFETKRYTSLLASVFQTALVSARLNSFFRALV